MIVCKIEWAQASLINRYEDLQCNLLTSSVCLHAQLCVWGWICYNRYAKFGSPTQGVASRQCARPPAVVLVPDRPHKALVRYACSLGTYICVTAATESHSYSRCAYAAGMFTSGKLISFDRAYVALLVSSLAVLTWMYHTIYNSEPGSPDSISTASAQSAPCQHCGMTSPTIRVRHDFATGANEPACS